MAKPRKRTQKSANASEMAGLLGVEPSTVIVWAKRGCPVASRKRVGRKTRWVFDIAAVKEWRKQDLERREKPRIVIKNPLSLTKSIMGKDEEHQFRRIMEGLLSPPDD